MNWRLSEKTIEKDALSRVINSVSPDFEFRFDLNDDIRKTYITLNSKEGTFKSRIELYIFSEVLAKSLIPKIALELNRLFDSKIIHDCYIDELNPIHAIFVQNAKSYLIFDDGIENENFEPAIIREIG